jgi:ABC-2 type transport system permease protein
VGFLVVTFGMPVIIAAVIGVVGLINVLTMRKVQERREIIGLVDESGLVDFRLLEDVRSAGGAENAAEELERLPVELQSQVRSELRKQSGAVVFRSLPSREAAAAERTLRGFYLVPPDYLEKGEIELTVRKGGFMSDNRPGWRAVQNLVAASLVEGRMDPLRARRLWQPPALRSTSIDSAGRPTRGGAFDEISSFAVPYFFTIFFLLSIMTSAGYLLQGVAEEKENRIIEILLSSVTPSELLAGKVLGLGAAGLTQIGVWVVLGITPLLVLAPFVQLRWSQLLVAVCFFVLGFLALGSLMAGFGSVGTNMRESQQLSLVWSMSAVSPMFFIAVLLAEPNGILARVLSFIPITAPITMMLRVSAASVPWWEIALSIVVLAASLPLIIRMSGKIFRVGILMYGKRPTLIEIMRWVRAA